MRAKASKTRKYSKKIVPSRFKKWKLPGKRELEKKLVNDLKKKPKPKKIIPCLPPDTSIKYLPKWNALRYKKQLFDGVIRCNDGTILKIHRAVISAASPYFRVLFSDSINRVRKEITEANVDGPAALFQKLVDSAYTGCCKIGKVDVQELAVFADYYQFLSVFQVCLKYMSDNLDADNCFSLIEFSRSFYPCKVLEETGKQYIRENIVDVLNESEDFMELPIQKVLDILKDDELNVINEETVFEGIKKWIEYSPHIRAEYITFLIKTIRMGYIGNYYIENEILHYPPVANSKECNSFVKRTLHNQRCSFNNTDAVSNTTFRPRIPYNIIFAIGGFYEGRVCNIIETYDPRANKWILMSRDNDCGVRGYHGLCTLNGLIYMIGGYNGEYLASVRCFDPETYVWIDCTPMNSSRCYVSVVVHNEKIYAIGGFDGRIRNSSVERYDPSKNKWELIRPMLHERSDAAAAVIKDKIYVAGGFDGKYSLNSVEVYDTVTDIWTSITPMNSPRSGLSMVAFENTLYVFGGFDGRDRLTTVEQLNVTKTMGWIYIPEMSEIRSNSTAVFMEGFIYVIGGHTGNSPTCQAECYDIENEGWFDIGPLNMKRSGLSACVVSGLKIGRHYSVTARCLLEAGQGDATADKKE